VTHSHNSNVRTDAHQSNAPSYYYPIPEFTGHPSTSYVNNAWYPQNETMQQHMGMPAILAGMDQLYTIDSASTPPALDFSLSLSPSPSPSRNDLVHTPIGPSRPHANFLTVSSSSPTPSLSPLSQSPRLNFSEPLFAGQKEAHWSYEPAIFGSPMHGSPLHGSPIQGIHA
jgi:hypothetical protein